MQPYKYSPIDIFGELVTQKRLCSFEQARLLGLTHYESNPYALLSVNIICVIITVPTRRTLHVRSIEPITRLQTRITGQNNFPTLD